MAEYMSQIGIEGLKGIPSSTTTASEDFTIIAEKNNNNLYAFNSWICGMNVAIILYNHPKAQFDENVCVIGAACFAYYASHWLENHKNRD